MRIQQNCIEEIDLARVTPFAHSASASEFSLPLTFLDLFWLHFPPVERLFFYRVAGLTPSHFHSVILPRLKSSLSLALLHYLPLSGRLLWNPQDPQPRIAYRPGDAVSLKVAESPNDMARLSSDEPRQASLLRPLVPEFQAFDEWAPIITLQVTLFPNQGFCIGIAAHHAILDGKSTTSFVKAWAYVCRTDMTSSRPLPQDLTPSFDRTAIKDSAGVGVKCLNQSMSLNQRKSLKLMPQMGLKPELARATFELTRKHISMLSDRVKSEARDPGQLRLSTFVLAFGYLTSCLVRARGGDRDRRVLVGFAVDYRSRLEPPVPSTYFGNCVGGAVDLDSEAQEFMGDDGFLVAVEKVSRLVSGLDAKTVEKLGDLFEASAKIKPGTQVISVSGSNRFGVYGTDFGWGRPEKVEIVSIDSNQAISLAESRDGNGDGVEIGVCLDLRELEIFTCLFRDGLKDVLSMQGK